MNVPNGIPLPLEEVSPSKDDLNKFIRKLIRQISLMYLTLSQAVNNNATTMQTTKTTVTGSPKVISVTGSDGNTYYQYVYPGAS